MGPLLLLPGEKEVLRLHPASWTFMPHRVGAAALLLWGGLLWTAVHASWWTRHRPSDWTAAWTWLWGTDAAAALWTVGGVALGSALVRPGRMRLSRAAWGAAIAGAGVTALALAVPHARPQAFALATMAASVPALAWVEAQRLATTYHVTNLRLVVRRALPRRTEASVAYADLVDVDAKAGLWPDTGTLIPVLGTPRPGEPVPPPAPRLAGVRPFGRVRALVEALAQRATASERSRADPAVEGQVAEALAALHRR